LGYLAARIGTTFMLAPVLRVRGRAVTMLGSSRISALKGLEVGRTVTWATSVRKWAP
jgi:hypothetical protein